MNKTIIAIALMATALFSCKKDEEYLPPKWYYEIPETAAPEDLQLGAYYTVMTSNGWAEQITDIPVLNFDEDNNPRSYAYNDYNVMNRQLEWADRAGVDFFIFPYSDNADNNNVLATFSSARETDGRQVKMVLNYSLSFLGLSDTYMLGGDGEAFDELTAKIISQWPTIFSRDDYYRMSDGRPILMLSGVVNAAIDHSQFIPALRRAMADGTAALQQGDPSIADNALDFYIIGEITGNWLPPQRNEAVSRYMDGNLLREWYPTTYYERWYAFYSYTDIAWQNWSTYAADWGNDFIPIVFPEFNANSASSRPVERSEDGYRQFCNVAKRNVGENGLVILTTWNDFSKYSAIEPTERYGEEYIDYTREFLKGR